MGPLTRLRVASANAASGREHGTGRHSVSSWALAVAALDVDVLAVQEVDHLLPRSGGTDQTAEIADACAGTGPPWTARFAAAIEGTPGSVDTMRAARESRPTEPSYGIALLTRHPVRSWRELRMAPSRVRLPVPSPAGGPSGVLWVPDEQRVALAAVVAVPGGDVSVVCTHLSFGPHRAVGQLRELAAWAEALPRPLLLLGDLNLPGRVPARLTGWVPLVRAATYPAPRPRVQLDHALLDPGAHDVEIGPAAAVVVAGSDHFGLRAEVGLPRP